MKQPALIILFLLLAVSCFSQTDKTLSVYFRFDTYQLDSTITKKLDSLTRELNGLSITKIQLNGYCDGKGTDEYNDRLSEQRAAAIHDYLIARLKEKNIPVTYKGFGKRQLQKNVYTEEENALNRRVDILITLKVQVIVPETVADTIKPADTKSIAAVLEDTLTKIGTHLALRNLNFYGGSASLLPASMPVLEELLEALQHNPKLSISIEGHICCVFNSNQETPFYSLSAERAKTVWNYLIQHDIDPSRLSYKGYGITRPLYPLPEKTEEERTANRRVEIRITDK